MVVFGWQHVMMTEPTGVDGVATSTLLVECIAALG